MVGEPIPIDLFWKGTLKKGRISTSWNTLTSPGSFSKRTTWLPQVNSCFLVWQFLGLIIWKVLCLTPYCIFTNNTLFSLLHNISCFEIKFVDTEFWGIIVQVVVKLGMTVLKLLWLQEIIVLSELYYDGVVEWVLTVLLWKICCHKIPSFLVKSFVKVWDIFVPSGLNLL